MQQASRGALRGTLDINLGYRILLGVAALLLAALLAAGSARAHVQVQPSEAAPDDTVVWTVLVPNERPVPTSRVEIQMPPGVTPVAVLPSPDLRNSVIRDQQGLARSIRWIGRIPVGEAAQFQFVARTPGSEGEVAWKALQTYADGEVVRWIGGSGSDQPAAVSSITATAPRQNADARGQGTEPIERFDPQAGHEQEQPDSEGGSESPAPESDAAATDGAQEVAGGERSVADQAGGDSDSEDSSGGISLGLVLALVALVAALVAVALGIRRRD